VDSEGRPRVFDGVGASTRGDLLLVIFKSAARLERTRWAFDVADELVAANPAGIIGLMVVLPTADPPDGPARAENHTRFARIGPALRRMVTVPVGNELRTMIVRTIMRAISAVGNGRGIHVIASAVPVGIERVLEQRGPNTPARAQIHDDLRALYAALDVTPTW
jgi:hypothetical protein